MKRFTEYLVEAPQAQAQPAGQPSARPVVPQAKPRVTPVGGKGEVVQMKAKQPELEDSAWNTIKQAAADPNTGREFITLLGGMYQAKRSNPAVQMNMPKLVTSLPKGELKDRMAQLFNLAKSDDLAHLAQRSADLQKARMAAAAQPGTSVQPGQVQASQQATSGGRAGRAQQKTMLQTLMTTIKDTAPKLTTRQVKAASKALNAALKAKKPSVSPVPNIAQGKPAVTSTG